MAEGSGPSSGPGEKDPRVGCGPKHRDLRDRTHPSRSAQPTSLEGTPPALSQCACARPLARTPHSPRSSVINPGRPSSGSGASPPSQTTAALGSRAPHTHLHLASRSSDQPPGPSLRSSGSLQHRPSGLRPAPQERAGRNQGESEDWSLRLVFRNPCKG